MSGITADRVAVLPACAVRPRLNGLVHTCVMPQRVFVTTKPCPSPTKLMSGAGVIDVVETPVAAEEVGGGDVSGFVTYRAAGDVEDRSLLCNHLRCRQRDDAADRGPLPDLVRGVGEITADLEQATGV